MSLSISQSLDPLQPMPPKPVKIAVVGCGRWGKNLIRNFHYLESLYAVCDLEWDVLNQLRRSYKGLIVTNDYQALLRDPEITAVVVSTPSVTHFALCKAALQAGKNVYVEKPIAVNCEQTQELFSLAAETGLVLMVGHLLLYHPAVNRLKQLIKEGVLGEIKYIQSDRLNFNPFRQDRSVLWDLAPHDLSMMCYILDEEPEGILSVNGHRTDKDGLIDVAHLELRFASGIGGHIHNSWIHPTKQVRLVVRGSDKTAILDDTLDKGKLRIFSRDQEQTPLEEFPEYLTIEPLKLECQHFINCIQYQKIPKTDGVNGYQVVKVLELAEKMLNF